MQGRITKVLNMKPMETLGMLEEAAGTRMFETKKQAAEKTIEKKEAKRQEIQRVRRTHACGVRGAIIRAVERRGAPTPPFANGRGAAPAHWSALLSAAGD